MRIHNTHLNYGVHVMQQIYDENAPKKATNLSINSDLLMKSRDLKINLSATLEHALVSDVRKAERKKWQTENKEAINALNELAENNGLFSDSYRDF